MNLRPLPTIPLGQQPTIAPPIKSQTIPATKNSAPKTISIKTVCWKKYKQKLKAKATGQTKETLYENKNLSR